MFYIAKINKLYDVDQLHLIIQNKQKNIVHSLNKEDFMHYLDGSYKCWYDRSFSNPGPDNIKRLLNLNMFYPIYVLDIVNDEEAKEIFIDEYNNGIKYIIIDGCHRVYYATFIDPENHPKIEALIIPFDDLKKCEIKY